MLEMDTSLISWIIPLTFLPGVAGLILSTSNRYFHVNSLIRNAIKEEQDKTILNILVKRSSLFHKALLFLYLAVGFFSISAIFGNLEGRALFPDDLALLSVELSVLFGVICIVTGSAYLIRESFVSFQSIKLLTKNIGND